jgi:phosphotransferase system HPr (HPr) family protein
MSGASPLCQTVKIVNRLGLHARAAGKLVNLAAQFNACVTLEKDNQVAPADSVMELLMLTASPGDSVTISATGPEAPAALQAVVALIQEGFGEDEQGADVHKN